jgi:rubrerythrin
MIIHIDRTKLICAIVGTGLMAGCASTNPPPLPPGNPSDPTVRVPVRTSVNLLANDETSVAIQTELSQTASKAKSAESMQHMDHGNMPGMQHSEMKMEDHQAKPTNVAPEKKALADEMKETSDEMKRTSDAMKQQSEPQPQQASYYTCPMHPQIHSDKLGQCPICGKTLIKKDGAPPQ